MDLSASCGGCKQHGKFFTRVSDSLADFIETKVRFDSPDAEGETLRQYYERFGQSTPEIKIDFDAEYYLELFYSITDFRDYGPNGPLALKPGIIEDWCRVTGKRLFREEIKVLFVADTAYRKAYYAEQDRQIKAAQKSKEGS